MPLLCLHPALHRRAAVVRRGVQPGRRIAHAHAQVRLAERRAEGVLDKVEEAEAALAGDRGRGDGEHVVPEPDPLLEVPRAELVLRHRAPERDRLAARGARAHRLAVPVARQRGRAHRRLVALEEVGGRGHRGRGRGRGARGARRGGAELGRLARRLARRERVGDGLDRVGEALGEARTRPPRPSASRRRPTQRRQRRGVEC